MTADASRWTIIHEFKIPKTKFVLRLLLTAPGWTQLRKLANPVPQMATDAMNNKAASFVVI
jgi:hypothetical protein